MKFTSKQIEDYLAYEEVRQSGQYNMIMDANARIAAGLSRDDYKFVISNFSALRAQAEEGKLNKRKG